MRTTKLFEVSNDLPQRPNRRRWWLIAAVGLLAPLMLILVGIVSVILGLNVRHTRALQDVKKEMARIRASGEPTSAEELFKFHRVPAGERDITAFWQAVFDSFDVHQFKEDSNDLPVAGNGNDAGFVFRTPNEVTQGEQFLSKYHLTIQRTLHAAEFRGECRFAEAFDEGMQAKLLHTEKLRLVVDLLAVRLRVAKARGELPLALESLHAMFAAARTHEDAPLIVEQIVRFVVSGIALDETEALLSEFDLDEEQLARLEREVRSLEFDKGLTHALIGERALMLHCFHHLSQLAETPKLEAQDGQLTLPVDCRFFLEQMEQFIAASRQPYPEALRAADQVDARFRQAMNRPLEKMAYLVTLLFAPAYRAGFDSAARKTARRELILCAIAAERFRLEHGRAPKNLDELVPAFLGDVPTDPFSGQQMKSKAGDDELVVYSVGEDTKDDLGTENDRESKPDIVVRIKR